MPAACQTRRPETTVGMGQIALLHGEETASAVLGSCVGLAIYDQRKKVGALAHVVLPTSAGREGSPGKFVDTAVAWMLNALREKGADPRRLSCKLTGGAMMFAANGPFQIGEQNIAATRQLLEKQRICIVSEHIGGTQGRRITFNCESFDVTVETAGKSIAVI